MAKRKPNDGKHLTHGQRIQIESGLSRNESIRDIARQIRKDPSTVAKEIAKHTMVLPATSNDCAYLETCRKTGLCKKQYCKARCKQKCLTKCMKLCTTYRPALCETLRHSPYLCNGCRGFKHCSLQRRIYRANAAQEEYRNTLRATRSGFDLTDEELEKLNGLVSPLLKQGQSPYHILQSHRGEIDMSQPTFYKLVESGLLDADNLDLKQKVRRKPRKSRKRRKLHNEAQLSVNKAGRLYDNFLEYMEENDTFHIQMDCVEGKQEEPYALLTLHWPDFHMQLAYYLEKHDSIHVVRVFDHIERLLGTELFQEAFPVILTDNGPEFSDIEGMERSCITPGIRRTMIFFCDPNRSDQKGACENNHKLIRDVIPKGTSLRDFTQADIRLMMNHINSYRRKSAFGNSAYDICMNIFPKEFFERLRLIRIPDDNVTLHPSLLKKRIYERTKKRDYRPESRKLVNY